MLKPLFSLLWGLLNGGITNGRFIGDTVLSSFLVLSVFLLLLISLIKFFVFLYIFVYLSVDILFTFRYSLVDLYLLVSATCGTISRRECLIINIHRADIRYKIIVKFVNINHVALQIACV